MLDQQQDVIGDGAVDAGQAHRALQFEDLEVVASPEIDDVQCRVGHPAARIRRPKNTARASATRATPSRAVPPRNSLVRKVMPMLTTNPRNAATIDSPPRRKVESIGDIRNQAVTAVNANPPSSP